MTNLPENVEKLCKWPMLWSDAQKEQAAQLIRLLWEEREALMYLDAASNKVRSGIPVRNYDEIASGAMHATSALATFIAENFDGK